MIILEELIVWRKAIELAKEVYRLTKLLPKDEKYGLISQIQRCSTSISANIAEGAWRNSKKEFINFLSIANGSAYELHSFVVLLYELDFINEESKKLILDKNNHIIRMNVKLQENMKKKLQAEVKTINR